MFVFQPVFIHQSIHVQYTQTDTIRQTNGPLVPMVGLVPIEKDVIPVVLLLKMHLIKVQGNSDGPLVPMVRLVPIEKDVIPMVLLVSLRLYGIRTRYCALIPRRSIQKV